MRTIIRSPDLNKAVVQYITIVADPPWKVAAGRSIGRYEHLQDGRQAFGVTDNKARKLAYPHMTLDQIKALPVKQLAADNAHLYLWTINRYLRDAFVVAESWGFKFSTMLIWAKAPMGGGLGGDAYGLATEYCLFCRRGTLAAKERIGRNWFDWKRLYRGGYPQHSAKPPEFMDMVERVSPGPYLELFARGNRAGWDCWGNECDSVDIEALQTCAK